MFSRVVMFVAVLTLGLALLWGYLLDVAIDMSNPASRTEARAPESADANAEAPSTAAPSRSRRPPPQLPEKPKRPAPSNSDIALLRSPDAAARLRAAETLSFAERTPALCSAAQTAMKEEISPFLQVRLTCLYMYCPSSAALDTALAMLPSIDTREEGLEDRRLRECSLGALAERAAEDPERTIAPLASYAMSERFAYSSVAMRGLENITVEQLPAEIRVPAALEPPRDGVVSRTDVKRRQAMLAAIKLNALRIAPELFGRALEDPDNSVRQTAWLYLQNSPARATARYVAQMLVQLPPDQFQLFFTNQGVDGELNKVVQQRKTLQDLALGLTDVAVDTTLDRELRLRALRMLARESDPEEVVRLEPLIESGDEELSAYARAVTAERQTPRRQSGQQLEDIFVTPDPPASYWGRLKAWWYGPDALITGKLPPHKSWRFDPQEPDRMYADTQMSDDEGLTWRNLPADSQPPEGLNTVTLPDGRAVMALDDGSVRIGERILMTSAWSGEIDKLLITSSGRLLAVQNEPGPFTLYQLNDAQDKWLPIGGTRRAVDIAAGANDRIYAIGDGLGVYQDGEWTWSSILHRGLLQVHPSSSLVLIVDKTQITVSPDGGQRLHRLKTAPFDVCEIALAPRKPDMVYVAGCPTLKEPDVPIMRIRIPNVK